MVGEGATVVAAGALEDDPDPEPEPPAVGDTDGTTALPHEEPVGVDKAEDVARPSCSTESPGSGKIRSVESTVPQPLPTLATNMSGRAL